MNQIVPFSTQRVLPANIEAEQSLLGALMMNNRSYERVSDYLLPEHFSNVVHAEVYREISKLLELGQQANPVTLKTFATTNEALKHAGGSVFIAGLCGAAVTVINVADYGKQVYDLFLRREMIELGEVMVNGAYNESTAAREQIEHTEERLFALSAERSERATVSFADAFRETISLADAAHKANGKVIGVTTGLSDLDRKLGGLHKGDLIILAGRPGMGKTALATTIGVNAAKAGNRVAFFSLEMPAHQLTNRVAAHETGIDSHKIRNGILSPTDWQKLNQAFARLADLPMPINDKAAPTISHMRTECRRLARKGLDLIIVDYLQFITPSRAGREENRVQEVAGISRGLKALAKDLNVPVLALSQLSRAVENREDKKPQLSDLRDSGSIEQDADVVMFTFREEYYLQDKEPDATDAGKWSTWKQKMNRCRNVAEVNIAKQRHGPVGPVPLHFDAPTTWFSDLARDRA